jgi:class 3 adenylate cyclase
MANLDLIRKLNEQYDKNSPILNETRLFAINEAFDPDKIEKALLDSLAQMGPLYSGYFDLGLPANVALLFIDVCGFSTRFSHLDGEEIALFFDGYYDVIIPIIYEHGGEVDKIIGDGIICVFGPPFLTDDINENIKRADKCAKAIIKATKGKDYSSKVAFHCGNINYFKNKTVHYKEFTMVGKPLTELFRLESISIDERVNYYDGSGIRQHYEPILVSASSGTTKAEWTHSIHAVPALTGITFNHFHSIRYNK